VRPCRDLLHTHLADRKRINGSAQIALDPAGQVLGGAPTPVAFSTVWSVAKRTTV
jgi:hypothetical protein